MKRFWPIALLLCGSLLLVACAGSPPFPSPFSSPFPSRPADEEPADPSCSYFYFLWGSHAEANQFNGEALEAYEKALICDPGSDYIKEKIPLLLLKMEEFDKAIAWLGEALQNDPANLTYHLLLANLSIRENNFDQAIHHYNQAERIEPDNPEVQLRLGLLYGSNQQYQEAERLFRQILRQQAEFYPAHLALARLLRQLDRPDEAATVYEHALRLNWSKDLAFELGQLYSRQSHFADALRVFTSISDNDHLDERAALSRIQALLDLEKNNEALKELEKLRSFSSNPNDIDIITSKVLLREKRVAAARKLLEDLARRSVSSEVRYMLALLAFQDEDYPTALGNLQQIGAGSAEFEEAVYLQVRILEELSRSEQAITLLQGHLAKQTERRPLLYSLLAALHQRQGENQAATTLLAEAVTLYPDSPQLLFDYGMALERGGESAAAMAKMEQVLTLEPDHAEALNFIGYSWADQRVNLQQAREYIERANQLRPNNGFIIDSLGWVYYRLGRLEEAARELRRAISLVPDDAHIHEHLGDVYLALKRKDDALAAYRQALALFAEEENKTAVQEKIDALLTP